MDPSEEDVEMTGCPAEGFDTGNRGVPMAGTHFQSTQESASASASAISVHVLLATLLERLLHHGNSQTQARMLFKAIGQSLVTMNLLSPLAISEEFSTIRLQHNRAFTELLHAAEASLFPQSQQCLNAETQSLVVRPNEGLFQVQTSQYLSDFDEICRLGKGSFGKVYKVKKKLDGQNYAVKKILIKNVFKNDFMKVLREVKVLSSLQHANIVGYHTAWMEHVHPAAYPQSPLRALESTTEQKSSGESPDCSSTSSSIIFQSTDHTQPDAASSINVLSRETQPVQALVPALTISPPLSSDGSALLEDDSSNRNMVFFGTESHQRGDKHTAKPSKEMQFCMMLYIQMQLCERSLKDWISERNYTPKEEHASRCPYGCVDTEHTLSLLRKILEGVEYIHSMGIMHRDLKPRNIFLHGHDCHVRIGDFGLACRFIIVDDNNTSASHNSGFLTYYRCWDTCVQLEGSHYDSKSDMYSIGVIALELFQPFGTEMERARTLEDLQEGKIPDSFCHRWPVLAEQVMKLTSKDPSVRPTATQLLQSELFSSKDMVIHGLKKRIEGLEKEIIQLNRWICQLQCSQNSTRSSESNKT